jgi:hypothetical protein
MALENMLFASDFVTFFTDDIDEAAAADARFVASFMDIAASFRS